MIVLPITIQNNQGQRFLIQLAKPRFGKTWKRGTITLSVLVKAVNEWRQAGRFRFQAGDEGARDGAVERALTYCVKVKRAKQIVNESNF